MEIDKGLKINPSVKFKGYQHKKSDEGLPLYEFNFPFDSKYWNCEVEFFHVKKNKYDYSYSIDKENEQLKPFYSKQISTNGTCVDVIDELNLKDSEAVAYRYKLTNKENKNWIKYAKDDDASACGDNCNLIYRNGTSVIKQGPMYLAIPDSFNPGYVYAGFKDSNTGEIIKDSNSKDLTDFSRTFVNKSGGTLAGIENKIPELRKIGYKKIITTPITGGDNRSSHKYWIKRMMQPTSSLGNINNFDSLQKTLFKNGMCYVSDGAYTSQGLEGVNFQYAIKWMNQADKPHEYYMFRMQGLEDAALGFGIVPKNMNNLRHKIVNSPHTYTPQPDGQIIITDNKKYNPNQPTYIQIYDNSLVSDAQRNDMEHIIDDYADANVTSEDNNGKKIVNQLGINTHDDTIMNNAFIIDPDEYDANINNLNSINRNRNISDKIDLNSPTGTLIMSKFSGLEIRPKDEGGFVTWDANTDMAKLSYTESDYDTQLLDSIKNPEQRALEEEKLARSHAGNRDMLVDAMRYWTKHVRNVNTEYTAKTLGILSDDANKIEDKINSLIYNRDNQQLPDDVELNQNIIENVLSNDYILRDKEININKALDKALMETPLDSIEFADDAVGVLSSPYISKRSPDLEHIGESRYDAMNDKSFKVPDKYKKTYNKMNNVFTQEIHDFSMRVLKELNRNSQEKIFDENNINLTEYGQYILPIIASDIVKYSVIKSLVPNAEVKQLKDGTLTYNYELLEKNATLNSMGIFGDSPEDEANQVVNKIRQGTSNLDANDVDFISKSLLKRFENTNALSFRFAEVMVDRSGLGLDWRIDAAKDVADMDAVRSLQDKSDNQLAEVINIWSPATKAVKEENPNSLILAEFTDLYSMMKSTYGDDEAIKNQKNNPNAKFKGADDIARILTMESGMNTVANYDHFFTAGLDTFGKDFVELNGIDANNKNLTETERINLLSGALDRFADMPLDYKRNAYTFGGNHDKPRMTECFSVDMSLFHSDLNEKTTPQNLKNRKIAYMIMNDLLFEKDLDNINPKYKQSGWDIIYNSDTYFNNVSSMAIAKANLLRSSIGLANKIATQKRLENADISQREEIQKDSNNIYAAYSKAIKDIVNGDFYLNGENKNTEKSIPDSYKKQMEKDGFGAKDLLTALDIVTKQAEKKYNLKHTYMNDDNFKNEFKQLVEKIAIGIPAAKVRMYTQMLNAIPGNPTVYAGDDFAMTGYDEKNHNLYLGCRNPIPWNVVDTNDKNFKEYIAEHKTSIDGIVSTRKDNIENKLAPLNNGTMYRLANMSAQKSNGDSGELSCPAIIAQNSNGAMALSVFNYNDISLDNAIFDDKFDTDKLDELLNPKPVDIKMDALILNMTKTNTNFDIPEGLKFKNIESSDTSEYISKRDEKGNCILVRTFTGGIEEPVYITKQTAPEGVLRLYYQPENVKNNIDRKQKLEKKYTPSFKGIKKEYFNKQYNILASNPYIIKPKQNTNYKLSIVSK